MYADGDLAEREKARKPTIQIDSAETKSKAVSGAQTSTVQTAVIGRNDETHRWDQTPKSTVTLADVATVLFAISNPAGGPLFTWSL
jgi:hypothetical protein